MAEAQYAGVSGASRLSAEGRQVMACNILERCDTPILLLQHPITVTTTKGAGYPTLGTAHWRTSMGMA